MGDFDPFYDSPARLLSNFELAFLRSLIPGGPGLFPGFGGAPPKVAGASAAGISALASRSDHTHGLDLVAYAPSLAGMQATGLIQQTFAAGTATPSTLTLSARAVPMGAAAGGLLTQDVNTFSYDPTTHKAALSNGVLFDYTSPAPSGFFPAFFNITSESGNRHLNMANFQNSASAVFIGVYRSRGTRAAPLIVAAADVVFRTDHFVWDGITMLPTLRTVAYVPAGAVPAAGAVSQRWAIQCNSSASLTTPPVEDQNAFSVDTDANVMLGAFGPLGVGAVNGWPYMPSSAGAPVGAPAVAPGGLVAGGRVPYQADTANLRLYGFIGGAWHFAQFSDFAPVYNTITAQAATALQLTGNAASSFFTSAGAIDLRANTGGVLGATSTEITLTAGTTIAVIGHFVATNNTYDLGAAGSVWRKLWVTDIELPNTGNVLLSGANSGISLSAATTQALTKANGSLSLLTTTANDVVVSVNSVEAFRVDNAAAQLKVAAAGITAAGAVVVAISNAPAGVAATPKEYWTVLNPAGQTRYVPLLGA